MTFSMIRDRISAWLRGKRIAYWRTKAQLEWQGGSSTVARYCEQRVDELEHQQTTPTS